MFKNTNKNSILFWGPLGWDWLHNLAKCYPIAPSENDIYFHYLKIKSFIEKLPCQDCKNHSIQYILQNPINLTSNRDFQIWAFMFHNNVNIRLGKKPILLLEYNLKYRENL